MTDPVPDPLYGGQPPSLDLPFLPVGPEPMFDQEDALIVGGVVVLAGTVEVVGVGVRPTLVFRFSQPDGRFVRPVVLVASEDQLLKLKPLVYSAVNAAVRAASAGTTAG